jgi:protein-tyrosine kinase
MSSSEGKTPDLVRRAAARLSGAVGRAPVTPIEEKVIVHAREPSVAPVAFSAAPVLREVEAPAPPPRPKTSHSHTVNISPTSLAANGISLPSAGFVRTVEEFRLIKRQILTNASRIPSGVGGDFNRVIMITSAKPGDGKTYTAINLALSIAFERDLKVLLVDADVYRQSMLSYLGVQAERGWLDLLSDSSLTFSDVLLHTNVPNLSVLPAGKAHPEVPELMSSRKMGQLVTEMARRYPDRFIIFDTLPCLVSSEPAILAGMAGQTIFVVAAHETSRDSIESSLRLINACPSVSLVLNKAEPVLTEQFGKYGYGYAYNYQK